MTPIEVNLEPVDASKTEHVQEPEVLQAVQGPEVLQAVQASTLDSEEGSVQSLEKEVISEDVPEAETVTDEPKKTAEHLAEVSVEPENKELPTNAIKTVQEPEVLESVQAPTLDSEEGSVQLLEKEVISEDVPEAKTVTDEPKDETMPPVVVNIEPVDASKTEHVQEPEVLQAVQGPEVLQAVQGPEVLQAVQASTSDSSEGGVQSLEKEAISENVPEAETVTDVPKEETIPLNEAKLEPVDASKTECVQEPQVLQSVQAPTLDSVEGSVQSLEKEVISEHVPEAETVTDEPKEETTPLTGANLEPVDASQTEHVQEPENKELPANAVKTVQEPKILESIQAPTSDSAEGSVQSPKEEVKSEDTQPAEIITDEPKEETIPLTGANLEPVDTSKEPEVLETVQAPTLESEEGSVQSLEKEVISEDVPEAQTIADEPKEEMTPPIKVNFEPEEATKTEHVKEPEVLEAVQAATVDSEVGSLQSLEKEVISEDIPAVEKVTDEPKQETEVDPEEKLPVEAANVGHVQEPEVLEAAQAATVDSEVGSLQSLEKEVISEDIPAVEKVTDEPKQETEVDPEEKLPVKATKTEHQEPEALPSDVKDIVMETKTDEETSMSVNVVTESIEGGSAQELVKQILSEDVPKPDVDNVVASVTDGLESEVVAQLDPSLEIAEDQKTESIPQDVRVEQEDRIPEVVEELQILTTVCVSSVNEEASNVQVLEKTVFTGETPAPCVDNAAVTKGPEREVHLSAVQVSVEAQKESELPGTEVKTAAVEHAIVTQVVICNVKDLSAAISDVLIKKTSPSTEPWIDRVASELVVIEEVETAKPLVKDDVSETAKEGSVVMMMHVPSVEFEDNHRIQLQVVADDIKSAETIVDTLLEVGVTEAKEVIDVCNETVKKVANLSATPEIEEELINEENKVTVQEVIQNVKENLPETVPESVVVNLEQEGIKQPDAVTEVSEMVESESKVVEDQKTMEESIATLRERQDEAPTVISEVSSTQQRVSEDLMQTPDRPGSLDVSIQDQKDDLEETERDKPEAGIAVGEVKSNQIIHEGARIIQSPIVPPSNTELVAPQNTGIISSTGNVESLSSLSIPQFGQANALASPPITTEIFEPVKKTDVSEVEVQAVEVVKPVKPTKQIELTEIAVQATETTEPAQNFNSTERAVIMAQPVLLDINIQAMETVEPVEQINSTERVTSSVQATETIQPVRQTEKREVILSPPVLSEDCDQETKAEEPVKRKEEDKDVWMDAEEDIYTQEKTEMSLLEVEESVEPQTESEQKEKAGQEVEMAPKSKNEEEESQQEMYKTARTSEIDSDGEDFAVALEHPEMETVSVMTMECN
ncbi:titin-like [Sebastes umbrosus]|uniref:titin-like n=1 Tax=Sebastes umbrosus TaxID=72105 RepID=UPI0018A11CE1|nr:titin-like [Sebastes umbrosus]XP_037603159.1 titin-like [Sebastes umbrosus]